MAGLAIARLPRCLGKRLLGRVVFGTALALGLSSCASLKPSTLAQAPLQEYTGRFSVSYKDEHQEKPQGVHGNFHWRESAEQTIIELSSPLGTILARITVTPTQAELLTAQGQVLRAPDAESLTEEGLGWRMPVSGLKYWLRGQAAPQGDGMSEAAITRDAQGRLATVLQSDWRVRLQHKDEAQHTDAQPSRLAIDYAGQAPRTVSLKLAVQE